MRQAAAKAMAAQDSVISSNQREIKYRRVVPSRILGKDFKFA